MADLSYLEKANIEKLLGMSGGYVLDFSDRTFQEFIGDAVNIDIDYQIYFEIGGSKAKRLRQFIKIESNYVTGKLLFAFCEYWNSKIKIEEKIYNSGDESSYKECIKIAEKLKQDSIVENIDAIRPNVDDRDFTTLSNAIRESIEKNEPETALDRLHTFTLRYLRELCGKHKIPFQKTESLNAVIGKYIKFLIENEHIESVMAEKILKYSINVIEAFNDIRNNKSFAHDNPILNYQESVLIFNNVSNTIKFIESIEGRIKMTKETKQEEWTDLPF